MYDTLRICEKRNKNTVRYLRELNITNLKHEIFNFKFYYILS